MWCRTLSFAVVVMASLVYSQDVALACRITQVRELAEAIEAAQFIPDKIQPLEVVGKKISKTITGSCFGTGTCQTIVELEVLATVEGRFTQHERILVSIGPSCDVIRPPRHEQRYVVVPLDSENVGSLRETIKSQIWRSKALKLPFYYALVTRRRSPNVSDKSWHTTEGANE